METKYIKFIARHIAQLVHYKDNESLADKVYHEQVIHECFEMANSMLISRIQIMPYMEKYLNIYNSEKDYNKADTMVLKDIHAILQILK